MGFKERILEEAVHSNNILLNKNNARKNTMNIAEEGKKRFAQLGRKANANVLHYRKKIAQKNYLDAPDPKGSFTPKKAADHQEALRKTYHAKMDQIGDQHKKFADRTLWQNTKAAGGSLPPAVAAGIPIGLMGLYALSGGDDEIETPEIETSEIETSEVPGSERFSNNEMLATGLGAAGLGVGGALLGNKLAQRNKN